MIGHFIMATFVSLITTGSTGWTTQEERDELAKAMKEAGKTGYAESDPGAWERHVASLNEPQPANWKCTND